jgi:hypothetical protein
MFVRFSSKVTARLPSAIREDQDVFRHDCDLLQWRHALKAARALDARSSVAAMQSSAEALAKFSSGYALLFGI